MNYYIGNIPCSNDLYHYGVPGMKWGVRKENPDYSSDQRSRDRGVYGRGGVRRINRRMNKGDRISSARSREADRIYKTRRAAVLGGQVGSTAGAVGGAIAGYFASKYIQNKLKYKVSAFNDPVLSLAVSGIVSAGAGSVGKSLGRYGGQSVTMLAGGYSPKKFRYN